MSTFVPCCFSRVACLEGCKEEKWDQIKGVTEMWLERPQHSFLSASSLFHSVTGRRRLATIKSVESWSVCFPLSIHESGSRSVCHESEPDISVKHCGSDTERGRLITLQLRTSPSPFKRQGVTVWESEAGRTHLELWGELDTKAGFWSLQGWAVAPCTVNTSTHAPSHSHTVHAAAQFLFKVGPIPPQDTHNAWSIFLLKVLKWNSSSCTEI